MNKSLAHLGINGKLYEPETINLPDLDNTLSEIQTQLNDLGLNDTGGIPVTFAFVSSMANEKLYTTIIHRFKAPVVFIVLNVGVGVDLSTFVKQKVDPVSFVEYNDFMNDTTGGHTATALHDVFSRLKLGLAFQKTLIQEQQRQKVRSVTELLCAQFPSILLPQPTQVSRTPVDKDTIDLVNKATDIIQKLLSPVVV